MCRGDTSLATMFWRDGLPTSRVYSEHECVNWEALDTWARDKMVDMHNPEVLVRLLCPSYIWDKGGGYRFRREVLIVRNIGSSTSVRPNDYSTRKDS